MLRDGWKSEPSPLVASPLASLLWHGATISRPGGMTPESARAPPTRVSAELFALVSRSICSLTREARQGMGEGALLDPLLPSERALEKCASLSRSRSGG